MFTVDKMTVNRDSVSEHSDNKGRSKVNHYRLLRAAPLAFALVFSGLVGCAANNHQQIARLEQSVSSLQAMQAEQTSDIDILKSETRRLSGRIEELEFSQNQKIGQDLRVLRDDLSAIRQRVPPPAIVPSHALEADEAYARGVGTEQSRLLSDGLIFLRDAKFQQAVSLLNNVLEIGGSDPSVAYALFWSGVAYDGLGDNKNALRAYNDVIALHGKHTRTPLALLRQASVFIRLGDAQAASLTLKKLIADYPKSAEAVQAREKLKDLPAKR